MENNHITIPVTDQLLFCVNAIAECQKVSRNQAIKMCIYIPFSRVNDAQLKKIDFIFPSVGNLPSSPGVWNATVRGVTFGCLEYISRHFGTSPDNTLLICIAAGYSLVRKTVQDITPTRIISFEPTI